MRQSAILAIFFSVNKNGRDADVRHPALNCCQHKRLVPVIRMITAPRMIILARFILRLIFVFGLVLGRVPVPIVLRFLLDFLWRAIVLWLEGLHSLITSLVIGVASACIATVGPRRRRTVAGTAIAVARRVSTRLTAVGKARLVVAVATRRIATIYVAATTGLTAVVRIVAVGPRRWRTIAETAIAVASRVAIRLATVRRVRLVVVVAATTFAAGIYGTTGIGAVVGPTTCLTAVVRIVAVGTRRWRTIAETAIAVARWVATRLATVRRVRLVAGVATTIAAAVYGTTGIAAVGATIGLTAVVRIVAVGTRRWRTVAETTIAVARRVATRLTAVGKARLVVAIPRALPTSIGIAVTGRVAARLAAVHKARLVAVAGVPLALPARVGVGRLVPAAGGNLTGLIAWVIHLARPAALHVLNGWGNLHRRMRGL